MPEGTCDPGPGLFHHTVLAKDNGRVIVTIRWDWDGVSQWPNCTGPIEDVRLQNTGPHEWLVTFPLSRSATKTRLMPSNVDHLFSGAQLTAVGLVTTNDFVGVTLTDPTLSS